MPYVAALLFAIAVVGGTEWSTDEDIITMLALVVASASLGWFRPRLFAGSALAIGLVVPAIAVFSQSTGIHPGYESARQAAAHGRSYAASLLILIAPALVSAFVGRFLAKTRRGLAL